MSVAGLYGDHFLGFVREIVEGTTPVPSTNEELWGLFQG